MAIASDSIARIYNRVQCLPILNRSNPVLDLSLTIPIDLMKGKIVQRNELPSVVSSLISENDKRRRMEVLFCRQFVIVVNDGLLLLRDQRSLFRTMFRRNDDAVFKHGILCPKAFQCYPLDDPITTNNETE